MKTFIKLSLIFPLLLLITGCPIFDCDCPTPGPPMISQYKLDKMIVEINTTNVSTGTESVFTSGLTDSTLRAAFCQTFVDYARFYTDGSGYFFIETLDNAWVVAHINHDLIGTSRIDIKDENETYFIKNMVQTVIYSGYGFVEYYRKNPASGLIDRKLSFVTSIPSAEWFIGTGFYGDPPENYYTNNEVYATIVMESTNTMAKGIGGILKEIYTTEEEGVNFCRTMVDHIRFFENSSGYFFIIDMEGLCIAQGATPELEGENLIDLQDTQGNYFIRNMIDLVTASGSGTVDYTWNNPASGKDEIKSTYVVQIPETNYIIGAGYYMN